MNARRITLEWVGKAEEDAAVAERESRVRKQSSPGAVCYHAQQCIEKYLKAVLQELARPIPKTHDLYTLLDLCGVDRLGAAVDRDGCMLHWLKVKADADLPVRDEEVVFA